MKIPCPYENHLNKALTLICTSPNCTNQRLLCIKCLASHHKDCLDFLLQIDDVYKCSLFENSNWIRNENIKQAVLAIQQLGQSNDHLFKILEDHIEQEFQKLVDYFMQKIQKAKRKVLDKARENLNNKDTGLGTFEKQLKNLYNFDAFLGILDSLEEGKNTLDNVTTELSAFFEEIHYQETQNKRLQSMADQLRSFPYSFLDFDSRIFNIFKDSMRFELFSSKYHTNQEQWTWSLSARSSCIDISEDMMKATKNGCALMNRGALGSIEMVKSRYQWEIDLSNGYLCYATHFTEQDYDSIFGIVDLNVSLDVEELPANDIYGMSISGKLYNLIETNSLPQNSSRKYLCDLDLAKGIFTISSQGIILAEVQENLKGKKFCPVVILKHRGSSAKLHIPRKLTF